MFSSNNSGSNNLFNIANLQLIGAEDLTTESVDDEFLTLGSLVGVGADAPTYLVKKTKLVGHHDLISVLAPITNIGGDIGCGFDNSTITLNGANELQVASPHIDLTFDLPLEKIIDNVGLLFNADHLLTTLGGELDINFTTNFATHNNQFDLADNLEIGGFVADGTINILDTLSNQRFNFNSAGTFDYTDVNGNLLFSFIDDGVGVVFNITDVFSQSAISFDENVNLIGFSDTSGMPLLEVDRNGYVSTKDNFGNFVLDIDTTNHLSSFYDVNSNLQMDIDGNGSLSTFYDLFGTPLLQVDANFNEVLIPNLPIGAGGSADSLYIDNTSIFGVNLVCIN
tara:strand:+ start:12307 stop:13323 length:1017 start_codon:yes stop_codon:yes gene_type:complete